MTQARQFAQRSVECLIRQSWDQKGSTRFKLHDIIEKLGKDHLEVVALDSENVLIGHEKLIGDLRAAVLQMPTWTAASLHANWKALRSLIKVVRISESALIAQMHVMKRIRCKELASAKKNVLRDAFAIRRITQGIHQRGMPASLFSWLAHHVLQVDPDDNVHLPPGHVVVEPLATESYLCPLHFSSEHAYSKVFFRFLLNWWGDCLDDICSDLLNDIDELDSRQCRNRLAPIPSAASWHDLFPSEFLPWLPESKSLVENMTGWARPIVIGMGTYAWHDTREGNLGLGLPQIVQVLQGILIVSMVPMKVLQDSG